MVAGFTLTETAYPQSLKLSEHAHAKPYSTRRKKPIQIIFTARSAALTSK
jgi:hypothetical protein